MHHVRRGTGQPLLLIHGLGGSWRSWKPILDRLAAEREEFGDTPPLSGTISIDILAAAVTAFLATHDLPGIDVVGSSMGARLVLELARRRVVETTVSLDPGGFWHGWERRFFSLSIKTSIRLVRFLQPAMPILTGNALGRTFLLSQLSAHPWRPADVALEEMRSYAAARSFDELLHQLVYGPPQQGAAPDSTLGPIVIGWGRQDRVRFPNQAQRALTLFPGAKLHWFDDCGHFPQWDAPEETVQVILNTCHL